MKTRAWVWGLFLLYTQMPSEDRNLEYLNVDYTSKGQCADAIERILGWPQSMRTLGVAEETLLVSYACILITDGKVLKKT